MDTVLLFVMYVLICNPAFLAAKSNKAYYHKRWHSRSCRSKKTAVFCERCTNAAYNRKWKALCYVMWQVVLSMVVTMGDLCRVARTHSRYWKLIKFNMRLRHFGHIQSKSNPNPNPTLQLSNPSITHPNSLQTLNTHLFILYISLLRLSVECFPAFLLSI